MLLAILLVLLTVWIIWGNTALMLRKITIINNKVPTHFTGFRIAQISDLHNTEFGRNNQQLLALLRQAQPDIIVITGDLVDSYRPHIKTGIAFASQAAQIAPTYYVTGNHEARISAYDTIKSGLLAANVIVLENERTVLEKDGERITLIGAVDPGFSSDALTGDASAVMERTLRELMDGRENYTILLSHRPELFETYAASGVDLVFSGHAHGGQFRLPLIGGIFAPGQGLFPRYDAGLYSQSHTSMVVSRGLGNSLFPFRINNRPEIVLVELQSRPGF